MPRLAGRWSEAPHPHRRKRHLRDRFPGHIEPRVAAQARHGRIAQRALRGFKQPRDFVRVGGLRLELSDAQQVFQGHLRRPG